MKLMSLGFLVERDAPAIWRGPIIMKIVTQFLRDVDWGELDYFIVDLPPGTGDAQLSLVQATQVAGRRHRHHAAGGGRGRRAPRRQDVRARGRAGDRRRREHERRSPIPRPAGGSSCSPPAAGSGWPRRSASRCSARVPLQPRLAELADAGQPILIAEPRQPRRRQPARHRRTAPAEDGGPRAPPCPSSATDAPENRAAQFACLPCAPR